MKKTITWLLVIPAAPVTRRRRRRRDNKFPPFLRQCLSNQ